MVHADTLVSEGRMSKDTAKKVLDNFDDTIVDNFRTQMATLEQSETEITVCPHPHVSHSGLLFD